MSRKLTAMAVGLVALVLVYKLVIQD